MHNEEGVTRSHGGHTLAELWALGIVKERLVHWPSTFRVLIFLTELFEVDLLNSVICVER